jgi:hypothetical protein
MAEADFASNCNNQSVKQAAWTCTDVSFRALAYTLARYG